MDHEKYGAILKIRENMNFFAFFSIFACIQDRMSEFSFPFSPHPLHTTLKGGDGSCLQVRPRRMAREGWWDMAAGLGEFKIHTQQIFLRVEFGPCATVLRNPEISAL